MSFLSRPTPDPHRDELESLSAEFSALRGQDAERLQRYADYRAENDVARSPLQRDLDPTLSDYGRKRKQQAPERHNIPLPLGRAVTVKHTHRVVARMPEMVVYRREETPQERYRSDTIEKIGWGIIRDSKGETQFSDGAWDGSEVGATCFEVYFSIDKQKPIFRAVDPAGVVVVRGVNDPHNFERLYRFWQAPAVSVREDYRNATFRGEPVDIDRIKGEGDKGIVTIVQTTDKRRTLRFAITTDGNAPVGLYEDVHGYGFVNYVVIPNLGPDRWVWGWADYDFIRGITAYLPKLFSREADILRSASGGAYMDKRSGQPPEVIQAILATGGVVPTRKDGSIEPIEAPDVPQLAGDHAATALEYLKMLSFVPSAGWGDGQAGSGSDRGLQLQPMVELTALKRVNWATGLSRLFGMAFRMISDKQVGPATYSGTVQRANSRQRFLVKLDPAAQPLQTDNPEYDPENPESEPQIQLPRSPRELFDGDYEVCFSWQNRLDPDDPAFVLNELNKFQQGAQSLRTTLERLGHDAPEDEIKLIAQEAEKYPWLRQGMIALLKAQLDASRQGQGGGPAEDPGTGLDQALSMLDTKDGSAQDANAGTTALGSSGIGQLYGG